MSETHVAVDGMSEAPGVVLPPRPYPGLRPFETDEWPIFFGRERMVDEVALRLVHHHVVFVHGDSGCGKSSLIRAGVFAQLLHGGAGPGWRIATALPRRAPLLNVATALARLDGEPDAERVVEWRRALNFGRDAPHAFADLLRARGAAGPACLLIDQFEELFQHAKHEGPEEGQRLIDTLIAWQEDPPEDLYVVMTMRSEYLGACGRFAGFAETVNATQYLLPRMNHDDILRAIQEPARIYDGEVTRELAERLIADVGSSQDQLPLIQHGLMRLHQQHAATASGPWRLGIEAFPRVGGLAGLLSEHADELTARCLRAAPPSAERAVEDMFRALTDSSPDGQPIRRPQPLDELEKTTGVPESTLRPIVDAFRADGVSFLTPPPSEPLAARTLVDIGHEALIRCWQKLSAPSDGWLVREFRNGLVWRALLVQADSFDRDSSNVLSPTTTDERETWLGRRNPAWAERYGGGWGRVQKLLEASVAARDRARTEQADALRKEGRARLMRRGLFVLAALVVSLLAALYKARLELLESKLQFASVEAARQANEVLMREKIGLETQQRELGEQLNMSAQALELAHEQLKQVSIEDVGSGGLGSQLDSVAAKIAQQADQLSRTAQQQQQQQQPPQPSAPASALAPRIYIHIAEESQRRPASELQRGLEALPPTLSGAQLIVPGIELVKAHLSRAELRCFSAIECGKEAPLLLAALRRLLPKADVQLADLSKRYGGEESKIRPRHYELWLPPGELAVAPP